MCWFRRDDPWNHGFETLNVMAFLAHVHQPEELAQLVADEVIGKFGAEAYMTRLCATLKDPHVPDGPLSPMLGTQRKVLLNEAFTPYFVSTGMTTALCEILERQNDGDPATIEERSLITKSALEILK